MWDGVLCIYQGKKYIVLSVCVSHVKENALFLYRRTMNMATSNPGKGVALIQTDSNVTYGVN
jgi:hypothetical protein